MTKKDADDVTDSPDALFDRIVTILEEARNNVVRAVNTGMVTAYWHIGREIVEEIQGGAERAEYGKQVVKNLSVRLTERYGKGYSETNLKYFRLFYQAYPDRLTGIRHPVGDEFNECVIPGPSGVESDAKKEISSPIGRELDAPLIRHPLGTESDCTFLSELSWSHYRALMRVEDRAARAFYEREAAECGWSKAQLERQIQTAYRPCRAIPKRRVSTSPDGFVRVARLCRCETINVPGERLYYLH